MELSSLPLMILLISNIRPGHTQVLGEYKAVLNVKPEPSQIVFGETVTLTCDEQGEGWTYRWQCDRKDHPSKEKEIKITAEFTQMCWCCACTYSGCSQWSDEVTLTVSERPKAVLTVKPEPSQILRGETVTLTCDVQGEGWTYRWLCDGRQDESKEKEFKITAELTQMCRCSGCRGSVCSHWSDEVTLTVSERPKAVLTVQPEPSQILRGETVTLTCDVQGEEWTYRWLCDGRDHPSKEKEFKITAEHTQMCMCRGCIGSVCFHWSNEVTLTVSERPKAVLTVKPEPSQILRGETVTLTCNVQGEGWTYRWLCDGRDHTSNEKEFKITAERTQMCTCSGCRGSVCSDWSNEVTLTVSERPKAVLTVKPEPSQILRGETVTLTCDIQGEGWTYKWMCDGTPHESNEKEFKITAERTQICTCHGCIGSVCSHWSDEVTLTVSDKPRVTVKPQSSVFTGDTVTLICDVRRSTGWRIIWYKNFEKIKSGDETKTLRDVRVSDGGKYKCGIRRENNSTTQGSGVTLTVRERPKAVVCVHPDGRVFRGATVTLTCDIQETDVTRWTYTWNKDNSEIHVSQSQEYRISSVNESHTGKYSCRGRETQGSRHTHTSDEVTLTLSGSHALMIGVIAGLSVSFLLVFLLVLLWRCKHNKGGGSQSPSTDHQQHNTRLTEEQKKSEQTPQQSDIDVTYTEIDLKSVNEIKHERKENKDIDVTYTEIDLKSVNEMKKKKKENKGQTSESSDTVYSKLKIKTG